MHEVIVLIHPTGLLVELGGIVALALTSLMTTCWLGARGREVKSS